LYCHFCFGGAHLRSLGAVRHTVTFAEKAKLAAS